MRKQSVEAIVRSLNAGDVRFLIAGGLAVAAHGYLRFTADVDLVLDFDDDNVRRAVVALAALGYRPRAPVPIDEFADVCGLTGIGDEGNFETVAGFIIDRLGRLPSAGDRIERGGMLLEVVDMDGLRIDKVLAIPLDASGTAGGDELTGRE